MRSDNDFESLFPKLEELPAEESCSELSKYLMSDVANEVLDGIKNQDIDQLVCLLPSSVLTMEDKKYLGAILLKNLDELHNEIVNCSN